MSKPAPYVAPVKQPCSGCPFRRKAMAGWLGAGSPESFLDCLNRDEPLPCHQTINYDDPLWKEKWIAQRRNLTGSMCAGALIFAANTGKLPRHPSFPTLKPNTEAVFATQLEFIAHHRASDVQSWNDADQLPEVDEMRERLAPFVNKQIKKGR